MTKEQFYRNCLTEEGQNRNEKEFTNLKTLKRYYKREDIDLNDMTKWDAIIYIPAYGKIDYETNEIHYQQYWNIYSFLDIIKIAKRMRENKILQAFDKNKNLDLIQYSIQLFNNLKGEVLFKPIDTEDTNDKKTLDTREAMEEIEQKINSGELNPLIEKIQLKLNTLPKLHKDIIKMRFGISDIGLHPAPRVVGEIAEYYNLSINEVNNIINQALNKLRE